MDSKKHLIKLTRAQMKAWASRTLKEQGGLCAICKKPIDTSVPRNFVVDHIHLGAGKNEGQIRGICHRSCNSSIGKMEHAVGRWGSKSMKMEDIIEFIKNALEYYAKEPYPYIYPEHKTAEEKKEATNAKRRLARAQGRVKRQVRSMKPKD